MGHPTNRKERHMGCGQKYCTCCETAYAEGVADGFRSGFEIGYKRGHRSGYISGYLDCSRGLEPLPEYKSEITPLIDYYKPPKLTEVGRLPCGCYWTCTCKPMLPEPIGTFMSKRLSCGCYGTCTCPPSFSSIDYLNSPRKRKCTCIGICTCGADR